MKIYRLRLDTNSFQAFLVEDKEIWETDLLCMDTSSKRAIWRAPDVYILEPHLKRGNFFGLCPGAIVLDTLAVEKLRDAIEMSGELLPLEYCGERFYVLNVTSCFNILDDKNTEWVYGRSTGSKIRIKRYAFQRNRVTETPLFKIPETCKAEILTATGIRDSEDEFKSIVEREALMGLNFEEIWSD
jgi:hypothetical protein